MTNYPIVESMNQSNARSLSDVFVAVNTSSGEMFGLLLLVTIFMGYYFLFSKEQKIDDLLASSFVTMVVATIFLFMNVIAWQIWIGGWAILIVIFVVKWWSS